MNHSWTGGQYSIYRCLLGLTMFLHLFQAPIISSGDPAPPLFWVLRYPLGENAGLGFVVVGFLLCGLLLLGRGDRTAAWLLFFSIPANLHMMIPFSAVQLLLLLHIFAPPAPFGSLTALGRIDPGGGWRLPPAVPAVAWLFLAATGFSGSFQTLISGERGSGLMGGFLSQLPDGMAFPIGTVFTIFLLVFGPMALQKKFRPVLWLISFVVYLVMVIVSRSGLEFLVLHFLAWNPAWLPAGKKGEKPETLFFDGSCGLCHGAIRFIVAEDPHGELFQFSPLGGAHFQETVSKELQEGLPDSVVLATEDAGLLTRSTAALAVMQRLGGLWRIFGWILQWVPRFLRDLVYNGIAAVRTKLFKKPQDVCPIMPPHVRKRFIY